MPRGPGGDRCVFAGLPVSNAEAWAGRVSGPDDDTAFTVVDGTVEIVSEGH
jgi:hypothetical protein